MTVPSGEDSVVSTVAEDGGEAPKVGAGDSSPIDTPSVPEPKGGDDSGGETPEPSAFESLTVSDIANLKDDELAGFNAWFEGLPEERKAQFPGARQAVAADSHRATEERRASSQQASQQRLETLDREADTAQEAVEQILTDAGGTFYDGVQALVPEESLERVAFNINKPELRKALDRYAETRALKFNTAEVREIVTLIQDAIEGQGGPLNQEDLTRMLGESEKSGKPAIWQYLMEIQGRGHAEGRKEMDAEWEEKMPGERAAIRTKIEKEMGVEHVPAGGGTGGSATLDFTTIKGIHEARRNGKLTDEQAREKIGSFTG